jgi:hypothetical protein
MKNYWDDFNEKYQGKCYSKSLVTILEAFWWFCNGHEEKTKKLLK